MTSGHARLKLRYATGLEESRRVEKRDLAEIFFTVESERIFLYCLQRRKPFLEAVSRVTKRGLVKIVMRPLSLFVSLYGKERKTVLVVNF